MNPLKLRDRWGYSETTKNCWIKCWASISEKTKTTHKFGSRNSTLGETKLIFCSMGKKAKKWGQLVDKIKKKYYLILMVSISLKILIYIANTEGKRLVYISCNNDKCFLVLSVYMFVMFYFSFLQKLENKRLKKSQLTKIL